MCSLLAKPTRRLVLFVMTTFLAGCQVSQPALFDRTSVDTTLVSGDSGRATLANKKQAKRTLADVLSIGSRRSEIEQLLANNELSQAETVLRQRLGFQPKDYQSRTNLGLLLAKTQREDEAFSELKKVVALRPHYCPAQSQIAQLYKNRFEIKKAEDAYLQCLEITPDYAPALLNAGVLYELYLGDLERALDLYGRYQDALMIPDEKVAHWMTDLNRQISARDTNQLAKVGSK